MIIHSYENSLRSDACIEYLRSTDVFDSIDNVILLPIPTTKDKSTILNTKVYINEVLELIYGKTLISGYGLPSEFIHNARERGALAFDLSCDEEFLLENAELTALCTLGIYLGTTKSSPRDIHVGVVGYGRIGKRLTNLFLYLGADVRVFTSREETRLDLCENGVRASVSGRDYDLSGLDILINTAPAAIFKKDRIPADLRIIDLASGDNFGSDPRVEKYPSIPAKMFPSSAGKAWGRAIERYLVNNL